MKRMLCILLTLCLVFSGMTVFGASGSGSAGGGGGAASGTKPIFPNYENFDEEGYYYGIFDHEEFYDEGDHVYFGFSNQTPAGGGITHRMQLYPFAKINGRTYSSTAAMMGVMPTSAVPIEIKMEWIETDAYWGNAITELNFDTTSVSYYGKGYSPASGTFQSLPATAGLPVYYCFEDEWYGAEWFWPYLDGNHTYDIDVYDYGVIIKNMWAGGYPISFYNIRTEAKPNGKMLSNIQASVWEMWEGNAELTGIQGELYDASGDKLQAKTGEYLDYEWCVTFTDLPAENDSYILKLWGLSGNSIVTPVYTYDYEKPTTYFVEGTVTAITDESYSDYYKAAEVEFTLDNSGRMRHFYCHLPVEVGDKVCNTVEELKTALPIGTFARCAESDHNYAFQIGATAPVLENYGAISRFQIAYNTVDEYVRTELALPDGTYGEYQIYPGAKLGDEKLTDINEIYDYIKRNAGKPVTFDEEDGTITKLIASGEGKSKNGLSYFFHQNSFYGLTSKEQSLPIYYYTYGGSFYEPYLDEQHYYDVEIYDYGVMVREMTAKYMPFTIGTTVTGVNPNRNLLLDLYLEASFTYGATTLNGELYDESGRLLQEVSTNLTSGDGELVMMDLPNRNATYKLSYWLADEKGDFLSPEYEKEMAIKALPAGSGTVQQVEISPSAWDSEEAVYVRIKKTGSSETLEAKTATAFYVDGTRYRDVDEIIALLQQGTQIQYIGDAEGNLAAVKRTNQPALSYGCLAGYSQESGGAKISISSPDGIINEYTMDEYCWLNGHFMGSFDNLAATMNMANSWFVAYTAEGGKLTSLKTGAYSTNYKGLTYSTGSRKFSGLPDSAKNLPVYYNVAGIAATPILDGNHVYDVILFDYAIEVIKMRAKDMDATICYVKPLARMNSKFFRDITVEVLPYVDKAGTVVKAQLLDSKGYVLAEQSQATYPYDFMGITFQNRPNQDSNYRVKVWVEDSAGVRLSPVYQQTIAFEEVDITCGTVTETQHSVDAWGNECLTLVITIPGLSEPVTVTCPLGTVINGVEIQSIEDLERAVPVGTLVKVAEGEGIVSNIQTLDTMQNVTGVTMSGSDLSADINITNQSGETITGTAYVSVYNKDGILKKLTTTPFSILSGQYNDPVPVNVEGITYQEGDYLKVVCMDENSKPLCNVMKVDIE